MQPPGYPPPPQYGAPPQQYGMPPQPQQPYGRPPFPSQHPPQKKSNAGLMIGLAVGGLVLVGVVVGGGIWAYSHFHHGSLPLEANKLPSQTREIDTMQIDAAREPNDRIKKIYLASELASAFCSGRGDPASHLESIGKWGSKSAKDFFDPTHLDQVRGEMECGSQLASALDDEHASYLTFESDDSKSGSDSPTKHHVKIGHFKMKNLPTAEGYTSLSFGTISGFCQTTVPAYASSLSSLLSPTPAGSATPPTTTTKSCDDKSNAAFAVGSTWFFSDKAALDELAKTIVVPKESLGTRIAALQDAFNETSNLPQVSLVAEPKTSKEFLEYPCEWAASQLGIHYGSSASLTGSGSTTGSSGSSSSSGAVTNREEFMAACFPAKQDSKLIEEIDAKLRAIAFETDPDYVKAGAVKGNIVLVTRDAETAESAERAVKELVGDWKSQIELNAPKLLKAGKDQASTIKEKKFADVADTYFQALSLMKVTRDGRTLKVAYKASFTKEDQQELQDEDKGSADKRMPVTEILEAIHDKKPIPQAPLAKLVGSSWATYLLLPPLPAASTVKVKLTAEECKAVQTKLSPIHSADLPAGDATRAFLDQKYARCDISPPEATETQKKCLVTFTTASDYAACMGTDSSDPRQPPESEFGDKKKKD